MGVLQSLSSIAWRCIPLLALASLMSVNVRAGDSERLSPAAESAVLEMFPKATIIGVNHEREKGVVFFEVALDNEGQRVEVEVTRNGEIGEIEFEMDLEDVSTDVLGALLSEARGARISRIERHEVRGQPGNGSMIAIDPPRVFYELEYEEGGARRVASATADGRLLDARDRDDDDSDSSSGSGSADDSDSSSDSGSADDDSDSSSSSDSNGND